MKHTPTLLLAGFALLPVATAAAPEPPQAVATPAPVDRDLTLVPAAGPLAGRPVYSGSYALLIGINRYQNLPENLWLDYAVKDVTDLRDLLIRDYGFPPDHVRLLADDQATKGNIEDALADLADKSKVHHDDRVLVYFSGHGQTVATAEGGDQGFLIPYDAKVDLADISNAGPFLRTCVQMNTVWTYLDSSPAKHDLVIADACYSGLLASARALTAIKPEVLAQMASLRAMQVMTAGTKGQVSIEYPNLGHGAFTYKLLEQLQTRAKEPGEIFTASDLYAKVCAGVLDLTDGKQYPKLAAHNGTEGEFLFITTPERPVPPLTIRTVQTPSTQPAPPLPVSPPTTVRTPTPPPPPTAPPPAAGPPLAISFPRNNAFLTSFVVRGTAPAGAAVTLTVDVYEYRLFSKVRIRHDTFPLKSDGQGQWQSQTVEYPATAGQCTLTVSLTESSSKPVSVRVTPPPDDSFPGVGNGHRHPNRG